MAWPHLTILWYGEDNSTGDNERRKKEGKTEEEKEDNIKEWTWMEFGESLRVAEDRERWKVICGAPTTIKGLRWIDTSYSNKWPESGHTMNTTWY